MTLSAAEIWRDFNTDGVPSSGPHEPNKRDVRQYQVQIESLLGQVGLGYATLALINADLAHAANTLAWVYGDATPGNNGVYQKAGASGTGSWSRVADLPTEIIRLTVTGGTGNAIQASASFTPVTPGNKLYLLVPTANNTGAVTLALNGGAATPVKDALGSDLVSGSLLAGAQYLYAYFVDHYQALLSQPVDASGILASAVTARNDAQAAAASAVAAAAGANSVMVSRTALAAATVASTVKAVICAGYAAAGDCSPFLVKRVMSQPAYGGVRSTDRYLSDGTTDSTNGGWWVYVPGPAGVDACAFGYKADWNGNDATATDSTAALQEAINFTSQSFGTGFDSGGGGGGDVLLPMGTALISSLIIVHDGVRVLGKGTYGSILKMKTTFSTTSHFFELGTPGDVAAICASQSRASAGDLVINGTLASGGVARFLQKRVPTIYSAGNDSARTFTIYGTDVNGTAINAPVLGTNAGKVDVPGYFLTVTRVAVDGATASTVTVGFENRASFGCKLEQLQLFTDFINAASGKAMVYTNKAQHTAGLEYVKIFAGNRHATRFETGYGGASLFTFRHVETFNHGNESGVASNNSQIYFNYAGLLTPISNIVMAGPGRAIGGAGAKGMEIAGGFVTGHDIHAEGLATGIYIDIINENFGNAKLSGVIGGAAMDQLIWITNQTDNNTIMLDAIYPNSADHTVKDEPAGVGVFVDGNIHLPTLF